MTWASTAWAPGAWAPEAWQTGDPPEPPDDLRHPIRITIAVLGHAPTLDRIRRVSGTVGNTDFWRIALTDADDQPVTPDGPVVWTAYSEYGAELETAEQQPDAAVAPGVYEWRYTPQEHGSYSVKAAAMVGGVPQATPATMRAVRR